MDYVHVLAYQNRALNKDPKPNAMILPIPSAEPLEKKNTIDLTGYGNALKDIGHPVTNMRADRPNGEASFGRPGPVSIFRTGSYTVAIASEAGEVAAALATLPGDIRPQLNREIFKFYGEYYKGWPIAICCWAKAIKPEPLMWWYKPKTPKRIFFPMLDAHNGKAPNTRKDPKRDHLLLMGSRVKPFGVLHQATDLGPAEDFIPERVWGRDLQGADFNRDYVVDIGAMRVIQNSQGPYDLHARLDPKIWSLNFDYIMPGEV